MTSEEYELYRVNTKISKEQNEWLDEQSKRTGISKSSLIMLAVQAYMDQRAVVERMGNLSELMQKFDELREAIERNERNDPE